MTTGLKNPRENERDLMTRLRAKYGPNYTGPKDATRPTRRALQRHYAAAQGDGDVLARIHAAARVNEPEGWYRLFGGAGHNKRKDMHIMGGTSAHISRGEVVIGTGRPKGQ